MKRKQLKGNRLRDPVEDHWISFQLKEAGSLISYEDIVILRWQGMM